MNENIQGREISTCSDVKMMTEKESGVNCYLLNSQNSMIGFYDIGGAIGDSEVVVETVPEIEMETELVKFASDVYSGAKVLEAGVVKGSYYIWSDNGSMPFSIEVMHSILSADGLGERPVGGVTVQVVNTLSNDPVDVVFNLTQENTMFPGERLIHRINVNSQVTGEKISIAFGGGRPSRFVLPFLGEHNALGGLQGGSMGEYFHLNSTAYEKNLLNDGEGSTLFNTFTGADIRENLESGERLSDSLGKLMRWYSDLNPVAWSGNASDLTEDASNRLVTDSEKATWNGKLDQTGGVVTGTIDMSGNNITGLASAVNPTDAINKTDLEAAISGIAETPSNVSMSGRLVKEIEITEPTSSVVFDNLDADADGGYELIVESGMSEVNSKLRLFLNNDTVLSNYKRTYLQHQPNNDITAVQMNDPVIGATSPNSQNYIVANIGTNGYIKTSMVRSDAYHQENYINPISSEIGFRTTVDNIYKMELQSEEANAIPVGTKIYLYRNKSGNGLPSLVKEEVVSSATRSITFSGLDALTDGGYELTLDAVGGTSDILYYVYFNGDTTDTNYERVWYGASATSFHGDTDNTANIAVSHANGDGFYIAADISPTGKLVSNQLRTGNLSSFDISIHRKTPITNLTEINIIANADIPVGTRIALYRKNFSVVVAPESETRGANNSTELLLSNPVEESPSGLAANQAETNTELKSEIMILKNSSASQLGDFKLQNVNWTGNLIDIGSETWAKCNGQVLHSTLYPFITSSPEFVLHAGAELITCIPRMSSNNSNPPFVAFAGGNNGANPNNAWKVFDEYKGNGVSQSYWGGHVDTTNDVHVYIGVDCGNPLEIKGYGYASATSYKAPRDFKLQGSDDNATWVDIQYLTNQEPAGDYIMRKITLPNNHEYRYYRLYIIEIDIGEDCQLSSFELYSTAGLYACPTLPGITNSTSGNTMNYYVRIK